MEQLPVKKEKTINLNNIYYDKEGNVQAGLGMVKENIVCLRPSHKSGAPQIYTKVHKDKVIFNNYGHSGEGYTILYGVVNKSVNDFLNYVEKEKISKSEEITIIGMGCIGLTTALTLLEKGFKNLKLIGEKFYKTPSFNAGGLFDMVHSYKGEQLKIMNSYMEETYLTYKKIAQGKANLFNFLKNCIREVEFYTDLLEENCGLEYLASKGIVDLKKVKLQLQKGNETVSEFEMLNCKTVHVVTYLFMEEMLKVIKNNGVKVDFPRKVNSFDEVSSKFIFNCTGLGSRELNTDDKMYAICGHGINLNNEELGKLNYILLLNTVKGLEGSKANGCFYFMPKQEGFFGGTFIKGYEGNDEKINNEEILGIMQRGRFIFEGIKPKF